VPATPVRKTRARGLTTARPGINHVGAGYQRAVSEHGVIIVGSGPAGVAAAESFRKHDTVSAVRMLTADPVLPYARPPLSKEYLRGQIDDVGLHSRRWFDDRAIDHSVPDELCNLRIHLTNNSK
jgi:2-polyprenyl-6-methoxyphenol hydroxylase-like FAD-dependent oxidoreductase